MFFRRGKGPVKSSNYIIAGPIKDIVNSVITLSPQNIKINNWDCLPTRIKPICGDWCSIVINTTSEIPFEKIDIKEFLEKNWIVIGFLREFDGKCGIGIIKIEKNGQYMYFEVSYHNEPFILTINKWITYDKKFDVIYTDIFKAIESHERNDQEEKERVEKIKDMKITQNKRFSNLIVGEKKKINVDFTNTGEVAHTIEDFYFLPSENINKITIYDKPMGEKKRLQPSKKVTFQFEYYAEYSGSFKESFVLAFKGFKICQNIFLNVPNKEAKKKKRILHNTVSRRKRNRSKTVALQIFNPFKTDLPNLNKNDLETAHPYLNEPLTTRNYCKKFHTILYLMEIDECLIAKNFNGSYIMTVHKNTFSLKVPQLNEYPTALMPMDFVMVQKFSNSRKFRGEIVGIEDDLIFLKFNMLFRNSYKGELVFIDFFKSMSSYKFLHNAVNMAFQKLTTEILFPTNLIARNSFDSHLPIVEWFNPKLNDVQKIAINKFRQNKFNLPYIIFGPPGTGKTATLIEAILQTLKSDPNSKILIAAPSNSTADNITKFLLEYSCVKKEDLIRWISISASFAYTLNEQYSTMDAFTLINNNYRIVISTIGNISKLMSNRDAYGYFTHLFIDEAGQLIEPEILTAMILLERKKNEANDNIYGRICLAGDPKQLGPIILSQRAKKYGIDLSYFERILSMTLYQGNGSLMTQLVHNYRSLSTVIEFPNKLFYDNSLIAHLDPFNEEIKPDLNTLIKIMKVRDQGYNLHNLPGVFFHSLNGTNSHDKDNNISWMNLDEAILAYIYTVCLYRRGFTSDDIGIITPYVAQMKRIEKLFEEKKVCPPMIGTVELFRGREKKIIILSTVRSKDAGAEDGDGGVDEEGNPPSSESLPFISQPKRVNVALTRSALVTIILGDARALKNNSLLWSSIIEHVANNKGYFFKNLPLGLRIKNKQENKVNGEKNGKPNNKNYRKRKNNKQAKQNMLNKVILENSKCV